MPDTWRENFLVAGLDVMNAAYTLDSLKRYMKIQETKQASTIKRRYDPTSQKRANTLGNKMQVESKVNKCKIIPAFTDISY